MKKKKFAFLSLLMPLTLLCACGGTPAIELRANWTKTGEEDITNFTEILTYGVTFESTPQNGVTLEYTPGTYVTSLRTVSDSTLSETVYEYRTELNISGSYQVNDESESFTDSIVATVRFRSLTNSLQPLSSEKHVICTAPTGRNSSLKEAFVKYDYVYSVTYDNPLNKAHVTYRQSLPKSLTDEEIERTRNVSVKKTNFFDNEQLIVALRAMNLSSTLSFYTINPLDSQLATVKTVAAPETTLETLTFDLDGANAEYKIGAKKFQFTYSSSYPGQAQTLTFAATTESKTDNKFRNMLLRMDVPVLSDLGTLHYSLVKAGFGN